MAIGNAVRIRAYRLGDRQTIRDICKDTANPKYANTEKKREAMCLMFLDYFLDFEPENCFVAIEGGHPVGYVVCSTDPQKYDREFRERYIPLLMKISFVMMVFTRICLSTSNRLNKAYNGGLHINVDRSHQGLKIGPRLLSALSRHLQKNGYPYMYLVTQSKKTRGYRFFTHFGFREIGRCPGGSVALAFETKRI